MNVTDALALAVSTAEDVYNYKHRHGAVIISGDGDLLSIGRNTKKNNPFNYRYGYKKPYDHAETNAILKVLHDPRKRNKLNGASLIVVRIGKRKLKNSLPCDECMSLIKMVGIRTIYYSDTDGEIVYKNV